MKSRGMSKRALAAIVAGVLIGGGVTAVSPAGAEVSQAAATNWKKIWKKKLQPLADKRYYTKSASDAKYSTKAETSAAFANYYTKAQTDAAYALKGQSYTKAESDAKYQAAGSYAAAGSSYTKAEGDAKYLLKPAAVRGTFQMGGAASSASDNFRTSISFGVSFSAPPTPHYIPVGAAVPEGCLGSASNPDAAPGHLCVFEIGSGNLGDNRGICSGLANQCGAADPFGAGIYVFANGAGGSFVLGTWVARPTGIVSGGALSGPSKSLTPGAGHGCDAASNSC